MKIVRQSAEILSAPEDLSLLELAGRNCHKSEDKITDNSADKFIEKIIKMGHTSILEFGDIAVRLITDRGVMAEITRHRHASFAIESTRYVKYKNGLCFTLPVWMGCCEGCWNDLDIYEAYDLNIDEQVWLYNCLSSEADYLRLLELGWRPEQARTVLSQSLCTNIVMKANFREWLHIMNLRCDKAAHPQIRSLMNDLYAKFSNRFPVIFP